MKVRFRPQVKTRSSYDDLTRGNVYTVIGIEAGDLRLMNDNGQPYLYPRRLFEVVDRTPSPDWVTAGGTGKQRYAYPPDLNRPGFFEDYFDGKIAAIRTLHRYLTHRKPAEPSAPATRRRPALAT